MSDRPPIDEDRRRLSVWLWRLPVLLATGGAAWGVQQAYRVHFAKLAPADPPVFADATETRVAPLARFVEPWTSEPFAVAGVPCVAVRVPVPVPGGTTAGAGADAVHLVGFSRVCTHQHCIVDLNTDLELVAFAFNHRTDRPTLTCGCHYSVFDPLGAGRAVSGPAVRPLPRVRLKVAPGDDGDGASVVADGLEASG
jgi:arsenite oxidase small subunit